MSGFELKAILDLYKSSFASKGADEFERPDGAETLLAFYEQLLLGIPARTSDLTEGLLLRFQAILREELPRSVSEAYLSDTQRFLRFIFEYDYSPNDWSKVLTPAPITNVCSVSEYLRKSRGRTE